MIMMIMTMESSSDLAEPIRVIIVPSSSPMVITSAPLIVASFADTTGASSGFFSRIEMPVSLSGWSNIACAVASGM